MKYLFLVATLFPIGSVFSQNQYRHELGNKHEVTSARAMDHSLSLNLKTRYQELTIPSEFRSRSTNERVMPEFVSVRSDTSATMTKLNGVNSFMQWYMLYFPVPFGSFSKETNFLFGLSKYNAFTLRKGNAADSITQASSISAFGYYTLNTQYKMVLESNIMRHNNKAIWKTDLIYVYYPLQYFGIGNKTNLEDQSTLNTTNFQFYTHYLFRTWRKWYAGPVIDFRKYNQVTLIEGKDPTQEGMSQRAALGNQSGLGFKISMEGRDNRLNANFGTYVDAGYLRYDKAFGSDFNYSYFQFDIRYYYTFFKNLTLATQLRTEAKNGDIPVQSLSLLGGDYFMRGTYLGRFRDNVSLDTQLELRFPIYWIFSGVAFGGVGQVANDYGKIKLGNFHETHGVGLRIQVDSAHDINLRLDYGFSKDESIFIMNFSEAF